MSFFNGNPELSPLSRLRVAVKTSDTVTLREVLAANPGLLNYQDEKGATPLPWAAELQVLSVGAVLVDLGANIKIKDTLGYTPRETAHGSGNSEWVHTRTSATKLFNVLMEPPAMTNSAAQSRLGLAVILARGQTSGASESLEC